MESGAASMQGFLFLEKRLRARKPDRHDSIISRWDPAVTSPFRWRY
jgi:hypothetical protein